MTDVTLVTLRDAVRSTLFIHSIESEWWRMHDLPLIVAATEVGYRYRGTGTDFWPLLEKELGIDLNTQKIHTNNM